MKNKLTIFLFSILSLLFNFRGESQQNTLKFIGNSNRFSLSGIGDIQGVKGDNAKLAYWKIDNIANFETKIYVKFLKSGKAGLIIREANATNNLQGGRPCYYLFLDAATGKIKLQSRATANTLITLLASADIQTTSGVWLSEKKENNKLTARFSYDAENVKTVTWTTFFTVDNAFSTYSDFVRGVVVASGSKTIQNGANFSNWKDVIASTPNSICGISDGQLLATKSGIKAYARIYDNKLWVCAVINTIGDQFSVKGVNWIDNTAIRTFTGNYNCFEGQITDLWGDKEPTGFNTPVGYRRLVQTDGSIIYKFGTNTLVSPPVLSSNPFSPVEGTSVSFTSTGCTGTNSIYKNGLVVSNSSFVTVANPTINDIYSAKCVVDGVESVFSNEIVINVRQNNGSTTVNTLADLVLPVNTKWNFFDPDLIPNSVTPKSIDVKTGQSLPNKWFIWHSPYRNLFGIDNTELSRITKMINKGVTAWNVSKLPPRPFSAEMQAIITPERVVSESYGVSGENRPEDATYATFAKWATDGVKDVLQYGVSIINGKYNQLLTINDYESTYTSLNSQMSANFHTVALNSMANIAVGRVGFQYGAATNSGGIYTSALYNGSTNVWTSPADGSVPSEFAGKSASSNNRIVGINEITNALESILPEGYQVQDQNNNNWFTIKHFGKELDNTYGGNPSNGECNAQHWATNVGVGTEAFYQLHKSYPNGGQDLIVQLKNNNETDAGFHYDTRYMQFRDNKYANYVNRYGILNVRDKYDSNGNKVGREEFLSSLGSENITNFMAEGQTMLAYFCGAKGINLWNSDFNDVAIPKLKDGNPRQGAKYNDVTFGNRDLESYNYMLKALWRLNQKVDLGNGQSYSFNEICDGSEIYLNQNTKVIYPNSSTVTQYRALDWQILKRSPVRAVVNTSKNVVFVIAFQAYGVEDNTITFKLTDYGSNINQVIALPVGKIVVKAYPLVGGTSEGTTIVPPAITSNVGSPSANQSVTLTSTGCTSGVTNKWYDSTEGNLLGSGLSYTVNAVNGNGYFAKCVSSTGSSVASNIITFSISDNLTPINVFVFVGESNAGTRNKAITLSSGDNGIRTGVQIWNNINNQLEPLNIGVNNFQGEFATEPNGWGWEAQLASLRANGTLNSDFIIIKTAQGGAKIGNYNSDITDQVPNNFNMLAARVNGVKDALKLLNKKPVFYIMYSQGINNALAQDLYDQDHFGNLRGIDYWQAATSYFILKLRGSDLMGSNAKLCMMKFFNSYGTYLNGAVNNIVNGNSLNSSIVTDGLGLQSDGLHFDALGTKIVANRYITAFGLSDVISDPITIIPPVTTVTPISPVTANGSNLNYSFDCNTKTLTVSGKFIGTNGFGISLSTSANVTVLGIDNIVSGVFSKTFPNISNDTYKIKAFEINNDPNILVSSNFTINCTGIITPIVIPVSGSISITEPNNAQYYFSNGQPRSYYLNTDNSFTNNLPVIYASNTKFYSNYAQPTNRPIHPTIKMQLNYSMDNDLVWMKNSKVKFGINLKRGGQLAWASLINETTNLVYNGYDGGFQVGLDAYQKKDGYSQNGKFSRKDYNDVLQYDAVTNNPDNPLTSYNTTMGGDFNNNSQSLLYYYREGNSYIIGVRPIFYTIDSEFSEVIIETKYTLNPDDISLRIEYKYISKRKDTQYDGGGFDDAAAPACFLVNTLSNYRVHDGDNLLTGALPVQNYAQAVLGVHTNKKYLCVYNTNNTKALGVYKVQSGTSAYCKLKQLGVNGSAGTEFSGGFTYVDFDEEFASPVTGIADRTNFNRSTVAYIMIGNNTTEIDTEASRLKVLLNN